MWKGDIPLKNMYDFLPKSLGKETMEEDVVNADVTTMWRYHHVGAAFRHSAPVLIA